MSPLLEARHVVKEFRGPRQGPLGLSHATVHAVTDVSFTLDRRETLGVAGESGCVERARGGSRPTGSTRRL